MTELIKGIKRFQSLGKCDTCRRPATGALLDALDVVMGLSCSVCAPSRVEAAIRARKDGSRK